MEDLFVDDVFLKGIEKIKFNNDVICTSIKELSIVINDRLNSNFRFLCAIRSIVFNSSHGNLILSGSTSLLRYSWVSKDYSVVDILQKLFGFSEKYIEYLVKICNKFLRVKTGEVDLLLADDFFKETNSIVCNGLEFALDYFRYLSIGKMQELLPLSMEQIEKAFESNAITIKTTTKDMREYVKSIKGIKPDNKVYEESNEEESDENVESVFDPSKLYEVSYFESQSKNTLINYCLQYQNKYVRK